MGAFKKGVFMYPNGMVSISIGDKHYIQLGREDAKELAEMVLKVVEMDVSVDERQEQARLIPAKDGTGIWFYNAEKTIDEQVKLEIALRDEKLVRQAIEGEEND